MPRTRLLSSYLYLDLFRFLAYRECTLFSVAHAEFSVILRYLFIFGASSWLIFFSLFVKVFGFIAPPSNEVGPKRGTIVFVFWFKWIKISLQKFGCVSSVFTVVLGRYRLQRLNHSGAECSFRTSLGLWTLQYSFNKR